MSTLEPVAEILACLDCTILEVNGDEPDEAPDRELWGAMPTADVTPGRLVHEDWCDADPDSGEACTCEKVDFTWSSCDACGSTLGGYRHYFTVWAW